MPVTARLPDEVRCIVIVGEFEGGFEFIGPFDSKEEAAEFAHKHLDFAMIAPLSRPSAYLLPD